MSNKKPESCRSSIAVELIHDYLTYTNFTEDRLAHALRTPPLSSIIRINSSDGSSDRLHTVAKLKDYVFNQTFERSCVVDNIERIATNPDAHCITLSHNGAPEHVVAEDKIAIVGVKAAEACLRGSNIFAAGVLSLPANISPGDHVRVYGWKNNSPPLRGSFTQSNIDDSNLFYAGAGILCMPRKDVFRDTDGKKAYGMAIRIDHPVYPLISLSELECSPHQEFIAQNYPSLVAVEVLDVQIFHRVLDCCAGPGGKASHIASRLALESHKDGLLIALEKSKKRFDETLQTLSSFARMSSRPKFVHVLHANAVAFANRPRQYMPPDNIFSENENLLFDRILVDAPCSGTGLRPCLSTDPDLRGRIKNCVRLQRQILEAVVHLLKPGGVLVYCTCSVTVSENEANVAWLLDKFSRHKNNANGGDLQRVVIELTNQTPFSGATGFQVAGLTSAQSNMLQRFHIIPTDNSVNRNDNVAQQTFSEPNVTAKSDYKRDTIGFFIAKFIRVG